MSVAYIPYNFFVGMYVACASNLLVELFFLYQYYNSRFRYKSHSTVVFAITGLLIFSVNYFANSGIDGSTDLIWPAFLLLLFAISPYRYHFTWLVIYLIFFTILHIAAYYHPELVDHPFTAGKGELIDRITIIPIPIVVTYLVIKYIRRSYDKERASVTEKALAIEEQNHQILLQKDQLEQSDAEKNKLMSIISHDMRAPLINIQGYLELLSENELQISDRASIEHDLLVATNSTLDMLTNLLQWSRSQMQGASVNLAAVNLLSTLKNTLEISVAQAHKKSIIITHDIAPGITVIADADMLQLVIRNLISNAIKFTPNKGTINITTQALQHECKITVSDNGQGIPLDKQDKIFSINTQPGMGTNNEKGVGLGLHLCKEFIERQGGRISFESTVGKGSCFFVFIPMDGGVS